jgi:hypothetical protein
MITVADPEILKRRGSTPKMGAHPNPQVTEKNWVFSNLEF